MSAIANDADLAALHSGAAGRTHRSAFPKFTDGRAYSQAVLLRRRYQFAGDIRATGDVLIDQLVQMHAAASAAPCWRRRGRRAMPSASSPLCGFYQGDVHEPRPLFAREAA
jgi:uncharacterized protein (DUF934 family)